MDLTANVNKIVTLSESIAGTLNRVQPEGRLGDTAARLSVASDQLHALYSSVSDQLKFQVLLPTPPAPEAAQHVPIFLRVRKEPAMLEADAKSEQAALASAAAAASAAGGRAADSALAFNDRCQALVSAYDAAARQFVGSLPQLTQEALAKGPVMATQAVGGGGAAAGAGGAAGGAGMG